MPKLTYRLSRTADIKILTATVCFHVLCLYRPFIKTSITSIYLHVKGK